MYACVIIGNEESGIEDLQKLLKSLSVSKDLKVLYVPLLSRFYDCEERLALLDKISKDLPLVHLQKNYRDSLSLKLKKQKVSVKECRETIKNFYENDRWILNVRCRAVKSIFVEDFNLKADLETTLAFLGRKISRQEALFIFSQREACLNETLIQIKENPLLLGPGHLPPYLGRAAKALPKHTSSFRTGFTEEKIFKYQVIRQSLDNYEKLRVFINNVFYLTPAARTAVLRNDGVEFTALEHLMEPQESHYPSTVFIDVKPGEQFLKNFWGARQEPSTVFILFGSVNVVKGILYNSVYTRFLKQGLIKIFHLSEWKERFKEEFQNLRSPLYYCCSVLSSQKQADSEEVSFLIKKKRAEFHQKSDKNIAALEKYYVSDTFKSRLLELTKGARIKIYLERACHTVAVKHFTNGCAKGFKTLGCEVFVHKPCEDHSLDYFDTVNEEVNCFKPDLFICSPNLLQRLAGRERKIQLPTLFSFQDLAPHVEFSIALRETEIKKYDLVFFLMKHFKQIFLDLDLFEDALICGPLPIDTSERLDVKRFPIKEIYDVGFVKSMPPSAKLEDLLKITTEKELEEVKKLAEMILWKIKKNIALDLSTLLRMGKNREWQSAMIHFYHSQTCLHFAKVVKEMKVDLALYGKNWELQEGFEALGKGHLANREEYYAHFLKNKINLSMNPLGEHHPRIFEGALHGAFFLVYQRPEEVSELVFPEEFKAGVHFDYFDSQKTLVEKIQCYLGHSDLRKQIGLNLQSHILKNYSYESFCRKVLDKFRASIRPLIGS